MTEIKQRFYGGQTINTTPLTGAAVINQSPESRIVRKYLNPLTALAVPSTIVKDSVTVTVNAIYMVPLAISSRVLFNRVFLTDGSVTGNGRIAIYERKDKTFFQKIETTDHDIVTSSGIMNDVTLEPQKSYFLAGYNHDLSANWSLRPPYNLTTMDETDSMLLGADHFSRTIAWTGASIALPSTINFLSSEFSHTSKWHIPFIQFYHTSVSGF